MSLLVLLTPGEWCGEQGTVGVNGDRRPAGGVAGIELHDGVPGGMTDEDLLRQVLEAGGAPGAGELARAVIAATGGAAGLAEMSRSELCCFRGIGPSRASGIIAALELGRRALANFEPGVRLGCSSDTAGAFWPLLAREKTEVFSCALLDAKLRLIRTEVISRGTLTASIVHPREAFRPAVRDAASGVIFVHNHPSGDPAPSDEDRRITGRLQEVGRILGIPLLDHVIVGRGPRYYSFADSGELEPQGSGYRGMVLR